ncbi:homeobox protein abdominal-B-like, partial [Hermetia illucens]|uniref:homeobox protein abdominal-B-like n=1 Tax=Hermetia illucens TaxID=343691 RepID=UPI0018CC2035
MSNFHGDFMQKLVGIKQGTENCEYTYSIATIIINQSATNCYWAASIREWNEVGNENYFGGAYKVGSTIIFPKLFNRGHGNFSSVAYGSHATAGAWWGQHHHTQLTTQQTTPTHSASVMYEDAAIVHQQQQQQQQTGQGGHSPPTIQQQQQTASNHVVPQQQTNGQTTTNSVQQQQNTVASAQTQIVAPSTASESPASVSSQPTEMSLIAGPLHIPAKRPGFDTDPSVIRHPHPWGYDTGFESQYHPHSQYYLERDRKPVYYGYPEAQFPQ